MVSDHLLAEFFDICAAAFLLGKLTQLHFAVSALDRVADEVLIGVTCSLSQCNGSSTEYRLRRARSDVLA